MCAFTYPLLPTARRCPCVDATAEGGPALFGTAGRVRVMRLPPVLSSHIHTQKQQLEEQNAAQNAAPQCAAQPHTLTSACSSPARSISKTLTEPQPRPCGLLCPTDLPLHTTWRRPESCSRVYAAFPGSELAGHAGESVHARTLALRGHMRGRIRWAAVCPGR